ncbi:MAG TPA: serine/threonine-protein kinase [Phototrophicaceae bacterium]|nr:serine/threonine-protein kinase [Phototrophicaceae bacterium]
MSASLVGQKLGKYEITELLGQGGMATVYKGYQRDVERFVAVKVLPPHPGQDGSFVERFRLEARTIARLQHPHILPLYDYGDENDVLYLVMSFVDGGSLADRIRQGAIPLRETQQLFQQIAAALDYAHRHNVIHRDIKPDNILLDRENNALLSDFGIAKLVEETNTLNLTGTGGLVGTPAYMSPEQAQGLPVDHRTDIYSLGIVLFEMLTGAQPFSADTPMQVVLKHITSPVPRLSDFNAALPPQLDVVMQHALEKDPQSRYGSAKEFYEDFSRAIRSEQPLVPTKTPPPVPSVSGTPPPGTPTVAASPLQPTMIAQPGWNPLILLGGFAIIALLIVAVVALLLNFGRTPNAAPAVVILPTSIPDQSTPVPVDTTPNFGKVTYSTVKSSGDTVQVQADGLTLAPAGQTYAVWLYNTISKQTLKLGNLKLDPLGNGQISYTGSGILPILYDALLISEETDNSATVPSSTIAYSGGVPAPVMDALEAILITSPDGLPPIATPAIPGATAVPGATAAPGATDEYGATAVPGATTEATSEADAPSSLLAGALAEAIIGEKHSGLAAQSTTVGSMHTHAEHTINILRGTYVDYDGNGRGENPGRGYGVAYFTDRIQAKLNAIASAPSADHFVQSQVELIHVCLLNVQNWMEQVVSYESQFLKVNDLNAIQPQLKASTQLADAMVNGVDLNQNGEIEPFEGECGLQQIDEYGIAVGDMNIYAGALPQGD